jgi:predicted 2-oxoglutarate/Fe(II)-dependent dioxygenase YbiX
MTLNINGLFTGELIPSTTVGGCIEIFENVWPNPAETIKLIEQQCSNPESEVSWRKATTVGDGVFQDMRTNQILDITDLAQIADNSVLQNIHNQFNILLLSASLPYAKRHNIYEGLWHEGYSILKYKSGQEYKYHYDSNTQMGRAISALVYLNDDYTGGHLEFSNFGIKIKPEPGMLILFPSNFAYSHRSTPITSGIKYSLVTWIRDRHI